MSAIEAAVEPEDESTQRGLEAALEDIARATSFYDFEHAWVAGLRTASASDGTDGRDRVLATAGRRLHALGPLQDDVARRRWLDHIADEVQLRGDGHLRTDLAALAAAELRETFALAADDMNALQAWAASGAHLNKFSAQHTRAANRIRDLGRIAESLRGSGLLALCCEDEYELAADLARAMKPPVHLVPTVPESLRLSRDDLIRWAQSDIGDKELPRLVRSLIAETEPSAEWIDMPAGTGVAMPGWDGVVRCARGNRFVPVGTSNWELTAKQNGTHDKAASDYAKRLAQSTPDERAETAYVSVACAPWTKARTFTSERSGTGDFGRVSALNADQLEDWLACAVATTIWMREQIGRSVADIQLLSNWWRIWLAATTTPLDEGFVLAGREEAATEFRDRCVQTGGIVTVGGPVHRDEIIAFAAAALGCVGTEGRGIGHVLFVDDRDTVRQLFAQDALSTPPRQPTQGPVLIIVVPSADYAEFLPAGSPHRMIVPTPGSPQADFMLDAVDSDVVTKRLESVGFEPHEAHELSGVARTSLIALRRRLAKKPALHTPDWAKEHIDAPLRACLLLGGWDETREGDREVVAQSAGIPYDEATEMLRKLDKADAPLAFVDQQWYGVSPADTWVLLRDQLTADDMRTFAELAHSVLTEADPLRELTGEDAITARMRGARTRFSPQLRRGIATTLALAGSLPSDASAGAPETSHMAYSVTSQVLRSAMDDPTPRTWAALIDVLPLLAEADPDALLQALRRCLADKHAFTQAMFTDSGSSPFAFGSSSHHHRTQNALEVIAWSPEHLLAVADVLARLAELDPGGQYADRPAARLASILCPWMPYTSADAEARLAAVRMLRRFHPSASWTLMLSMLPNGHELQFPGALPRFRNWRPAQPTVTRSELTEVTRSVATMLLKDLGDDSERWVHLIERADDLPDDARSDLISRLGKLATDGADDLFKSRLWPTLHEFVTRHRQFSDAHWALKESELRELERIRHHLRPPEPEIVFGHLFSAGLMYIDGVRLVDGRAEFQSALQSRQTEAVNAVLSRDGFDAVLDFAASVKQPRDIGAALGRCDPTLDVRMLRAMEAATEPVTQVSLGYFDYRFASLGWHGVSELLAAHDVSAQVMADILRSPPPIEKPWTRVDALGVDVAKEYWNRVSSYDLGLPDDLGQLLEVCQRLRAANRLQLAVDILALSASAHHMQSRFAEEAIACLEQWAECPDEDAGRAVMTRWGLVEMFNSLSEHRHRLGPERIAMLEWQFLPLLRDVPEFTSTNLYREMARSPDFFVYLVELAFTSTDPQPDPPPALTDARRQSAINAFQILRSWPESEFAPVVDDEGKLDEDSLNDWVEIARERLAASKRSVIGDEMIGAALASSPPDPDSGWPGIAVRNLLERLQCDDIERGVSVAMRNRRGATVRAPTGGGDQERELAAVYWGQSRRFKEWPRTAAIFDNLANGYEHLAEVEDREAEAHRRGLPL